MTCGDDDGFDVETCDIIIENKSGDNIYIKSFPFRYDTTLLTPRYVFERSESGYPRKIGKDCVVKDIASLEGLKRGYKYQLIIFKQSTMDKYSKEELVEKNIFDKRYVLSLNHLASMGFRIIYNGESDIEQTDLQ